MATHVRVIGVLYLLTGGMFVVGAFFTQAFLALLAGFLSASDDQGAVVGATLLGFAGVALSVLFLTFALTFVVTGWGLLKFRPWARILGIVVGAISLTKVPFGTLLGIYTLVILFRKDTEKLFESGSRF